MDKEKLHKECIRFWGKRKQMRMVQEECSELILAISHYLRKEESEGTWDNSALDEVIEETADVFNMVEQGRYMVGKEAVDKIRVEKLERTNGRLERCKKHEK